MTDDFIYRQLPRYANSDLSELAARHFNRPRGGPSRFTCSQATLDFGTAFHTLILEPERISRGDLICSEYDNKTYYQLRLMYQAVADEPGLAALIEASECETVRQWVDEATGLPCKGKIDAIVLPRRRHLIDLKTTSCATKAKFLDSCLEYDYDRQAAFYLSSDPNAQFFEFVGVRKTKPYSVYRVAFHREDNFIQQGMKKANRLLRLAKETGFVPGSWSKKQETV